MLQAYISEKSLQIGLRSAPPDEINVFLEAFFVETRRKDGSPYKKNSLTACRAAVQRLLSSRGLNIFKDVQFHKTNKVFNSMLKQRRKDGEEQQVQHHEPITSADWERIQESFSDTDTTTDAVKLCQYVWFHITVHFCLRGSEVQTQMMKQDLDFVTSGDGSEMIKLSRDFMSKNHQSLAFSTAGCITDEVQVTIIRKYVSKLNSGVDRLFQRAPMNVNETMTCWYMKSPLSHNILGVMLRRITEAANCSKQYTNHSLRATSITHMKQQGVEDRKIATVSGHKSIDSLKSYDRTSEEEAKMMAAAIDKKPVSAITSSSVSVPPSASSACTSHVSLSAGKEKSSSPDVLLNAHGAVFNNVTFSTIIQKPRKRLSLKLKKRENSYVHF